MFHVEEAIRMKPVRLRILAFVLFGAGIVLLLTGAWLMLKPDMYLSSVRVLPDFDRLISDGSEHPVDYTSMINLELEAIQSDAVLSNVVEKLDLKMAWEQRHGSSKPL